MQIRLNGEVNHIEVQNTDAASDLLRRHFGLTGTKESCTTGACGACTILVDDTPVLACLLPAKTLEGRRVQTIEGLGPTLHPVQRALMAHDGLQCGFCTPGFVMQGVAFYREWRARNGTTTPTRADVAAAFCGHLCRCGAYNGILDGIAAACEGDFDADVDLRYPRHDAREKVTGQAEFTVDVRLDGMLFGAILRSPHAHARLRRLDLSTAMAGEGVRAVVALTEPGAEIRYVGQEIAAVAADSPMAADDALALIATEYEVLPAAVGMDAARQPDAPQVYRLLSKRPSESELPIPPERWHHNVRGPFFLFSHRMWKAHRTIKRAQEQPGGHVVSQRWRTQGQCHTPLEPHAAVAVWTDNIQLTVHLSTQACSEMARDIAARWGLHPDRVTVLAPYVGGAFGGKSGLTQETVAAIELAKAANAPVRVALSRHEELMVGGYRPGVEIDGTVVADESGQVTAISMRAYTDGGAAVGSSVVSLMRFPLPKVPKLLLDFDVVSHMPPAVPFRGPGGPAACWALERSITMLAAQQGVDSLALRQLQPGSLGRQRHLWDWVSTLPIWIDRDRIVTPTERYRRGVGLALGAWGYFIQPHSDVELTVENGHLTVGTASQDLGTGSRSVLADVVGGVFGMRPQDVRVEMGRSTLARGPISSGSRTTASIRPAALEGAEQMQQRLLQLARSTPSLGAATLASGGLSCSGRFVPWPEVFAAVPPTRVVASRPRDRVPFVLPFAIGDFQIGRGVPVSAHVAEVEVDTALGRIRVPRIWAAISVGDIASVPLATSQARGGAIQGLGYALYEERVLDLASGVPLTVSMDDYRIPGIADVPEISVEFIAGGFSYVKGGGVGLGEITTIAVSAAIGNAVAHATGWQPTELPLHPPRVLAGLAGVAS